MRVKYFKRLGVIPRINSKRNLVYSLISCTINTCYYTIRKELNVIQINVCCF